MRLEQTIRSTMTEAMDMDGRLDQLVRAGLMPTSSLPLLKRAIARMHAGMSLQGAERDVMNMFISSMMFIVLGDDTVFNKARAGAKTYATEAKEKTEYDYEGDMAMSQLKSIIANSQQMHDMLSEDTNLPEWVQSKITLAEDYISTASNYMQGEMNEEKMPFKGPYRKVGERKDKYGNPIKNVAKHLAKKAMNAQKNEETTVDKFLAGADKVKSDNKKMIKHLGLKRGETVKKGNVTTTKYTPEEVQIDELSKKTLSSYVVKSLVPSSEKSVSNLASKGGYKLGKAHDDDYTAGEKEDAKSVKRSLGVLTAVRKLTKEDSEQIDELSNKTLDNYKEKAAREIRDADDNDDNRHYNKRMKGYTSALKAGQRNHQRIHGNLLDVKKTTKEEVERGNFDTPKSRRASRVRPIAKPTMNPAAEKPKKPKIENGNPDMSQRAQELRTARKQPPKPEVKPTMNPAFKPKTSQSRVGTLARVRAGMAKRLNNGNVKEDIDAVKQMNESYKTAFETALNEYGIKSPSELDESKRKEFFNHVDLEFKKGDN